jgi:hypothetical protein
MKRKKNVAILGGIGTEIGTVRQVAEVLHVKILKGRREELRGIMPDPHRSKNKKIGSGSGSASRRCQTV